MPSSSHPLPFEFAIFSRCTSLSADNSQTVNSPILRVQASVVLPSISRVSWHSARVAQLSGKRPFVNPSVERRRDNKEKVAQLWIRRAAARHRLCVSASAKWWCSAKHFKSIGGELEVHRSRGVKSWEENCGVFEDYGETGRVQTPSPTSQRWRVRGDLLNVITPSAKY